MASNYHIPFSLEPRRKDSGALLALSGGKMIEVYIGIGSNKSRKKNIRKALAELQRTFGELTISSVYESDAVGSAKGRFYNSYIKGRFDCRTGD